LVQQPSEAMVWVWQPDTKEALRGLSPSPAHRHAAPGGWPSHEVGHGSLLASFAPDVAYRATGPASLPFPMAADPAIASPVKLDRNPLPFPNGNGPGRPADPAMMSPPRIRQGFDFSLGRGFAHSMLQGAVIPQEASPFGAGVGLSPRLVNGPMQFMNVPAMPGHSGAMQFMNGSAIAGHDRHLVNVPVQTLSQLASVPGATLRNTTPPPQGKWSPAKDAMSNGILSKIGGILADAERELAEDAELNPDLVNMANSPAIDWLDRKIQALQERQSKRSEQQSHLSELRRMAGGNSQDSRRDGIERGIGPDLSAGSGSPDVPIVFENGDVSSVPIDVQLLQADHAVLRHQVMQLRRQRTEQDREREELAGVRASLEAETESRLKDTHSVAEAIEAGERRAQVAEEAAVERIREVELQCHALRLKLEATEGALEKERLISQEALDVQASAEADLSAVKDISHKVLGDCRTLQARIQELELERNSSSEAQGKLRSLEQTCGQLEDDNNSLRLQLEQTALASEQAAFLASPRREETEEAFLQQERILQLREELAEAEAEVVVAPQLEVPRINKWGMARQLTQPGGRDTYKALTAQTSPAARHSEAPAALQLPTSGALARRQSALRIQELEREMAAVHRDTLSLDGVERMPRPDRAQAQLGVPSSSKASRRHSAAPDMGRGESAERRHSAASDFRRQSSDATHHRGSQVPQQSNHMANHRRPMQPGFSGRPQGMDDHFASAGKLNSQMRELAAEVGNWADNGNSSLASDFADDGLAVGA